MFSLWEESIETGYMYELDYPDIKKGLINKYDTII
jgi:hypothetical protein